MTGVEEKPGVGARHRHEAVDVGGGLDDRAHVVVVAHLHALLGGVLRQSLVAGGETLPLGVGHDRPMVHRYLVVAVHGIRALAGVDMIAASGAGEVDPSLEGLLLRLDVVGEEVGRVPAGGEAQAVLAELRLQRGALVGHLVALLDAVEADPPAVRRGSPRAKGGRRGSSRHRSTRRWGWFRRGSSRVPQLKTRWRAVLAS